MGVYIQGLGNISIQNTFGQTGFPEPVWHKESYVRCIDPDFKNFISPIDARRMSKLIKRAIITAKAAIADSEIEMPDAIISGTGLGSIDDTEKFLNAMIDNNEKFLQPTYFIQSTHNTISSQIAINLKCYGHNNTFVHGGISFECALSEAMMLFKDKRINSALIGGYDEMTPAYFKLLGRVGLWKTDVIDSIELRNSISPGTFAGEGSVSVVLSGNKTGKSYASIEDIDLLYQPENIETSIKTFISRNGLKIDDIDVVAMGINGNAPGDLIYKKIGSGLFAGNAQAWYKHLSGEYFTSTGFGVWLIANCLKYRKVPEYVNLNNKSVGNLQNVLLINHYRNKNYSLILFSAC
jgi:3-oxoacyl-[acyl-carrier-protein] synthase II